MKHYDLTRLKHRCNFGDIESKKNPYTGVAVPMFVPKEPRYYGEVSNTMEQNYLVTGLKLEYSTNIVVRHDKNLKDYQAVMIDGAVYNIEKYESDDTINAFDVVTLGKLNKGIAVADTKEG